MCNKKYSMIAVSSATSKNDFLVIVHDLFLSYFFLLLNSYTSYKLKNHYTLILQFTIIIFYYHLKLW